MATQPRTGLPQIWVTHLAGLLIGDRQCETAAWMKAHFLIEKRDRGFDSAGWKADHQSLLAATADRLTLGGWTMKRENQNFFRCTGSTAVVSGKPDLVGRKGAAVRVWDTKTGAPKEADTAQVAIYILLLPLVWNTPNLQIDGCVVYKDHDVSVHWETAQPMRPTLFALIRRIAGAGRPAAIPSESECRWCDLVDADCADRFTTAATSASTVEW